MKALKPSTAGDQAVDGLHRAEDAVELELLEFGENGRAVREVGEKAVPDAGDAQRGREAKHGPRQLARRSSTMECEVLEAI